MEHGGLFALSKLGSFISPSPLCDCVRVTSALPCTLYFDNEKDRRPLRWSLLRLRHGRIKSIHTCPTHNGRAGTPHCFIPTFQSCLRCLSSAQGAMPSKPRWIFEDMPTMHEDRQTMHLHRAPKEETAEANGYKGRRARERSSGHAGSVR